MDEPSAPVPQPVPEDYRGLWKTYAGWTADAAKRRDAALTSVDSVERRGTISPAAASASRERIKTEYREEIQGYRSGPTYQQLSSGYESLRTTHWTTMIQAYHHDTAAGERFHDQWKAEFAGRSAEEYFEGRFGMPEPSSSAVAPKPDPRPKRRPSGGGGSPIEAFGVGESVPWFQL